MELCTGFSPTEACLQILVRLRWKRACCFLSFRSSFWSDVLVYSGGLMRFTSAQMIWAYPSGSEDWKLSFERSFSKWHWLGFADLGCISERKEMGFINGVTERNYPFLSTKNVRGNGTVLGNSSLNILLQAGNYLVLVWLSLSSLWVIIRRSLNNWDWKGPTRTTWIQNGQNYGALSLSFILLVEIIHLELSIWRMGLKKWWDGCVF